MRLSKFTIGLGIYIIVSASFARQLSDFLKKLWGEYDLRIISLTIPLIVIIFLFIRIFVNRLNFVRAIINILILATAFIYVWSMPYFIEITHILEYGLLGWLAARDLSKQKITNRGIVLSILFVFLISALDETFQYFLPYRVGEIRDVITNLNSGIIGTALFLFK
jgi:hypothetical protein